MGTEFLVRGDENVLKLTVVMVAQLGEYTTAIDLYTFKWVNCMVCELFFYMLPKTKRTLIELYAGKGEYNILKFFKNILKKIKKAAPTF